MKLAIALTSFVFCVVLVEAAVSQETQTAESGSVAQEIQISFTKFEGTVSFKLPANFEKVPSTSKTSTIWQSKPQIVRGSGGNSDLLLENISIGAYRSPIDLLIETGDQRRSTMEGYVIKHIIDLDRRESRRPILESMQIRGDS